MCVCVCVCVCVRERERERERERGIRGLLRSPNEHSHTNHRVYAARVEHAYKQVRLRIYCCVEFLLCILHSQAKAAAPPAGGTSHAHVL